MSKKITILMSALLVLCVITGIKPSAKQPNHFVLNGNALAETNGYEKEIGMNFENNQEIVTETNDKIGNILTNQTKEDQMYGSGKSFTLEKVSLKPNIAKNIAEEDKVVEETEKEESVTSQATTNESTTSQTTTTNKPASTETTNKEVSTEKTTENKTEYTKTNSNIISGFDPNASNVTYMGNFKLTAYCSCYSCSEGYGNNTATGRKAQANRTIAVDPSVIPYGTIVVIERNGVYYEYVAEDCGGAIKNNKIDVYFDSHSTACDFGVRYGNVYIVK